MTILTYLSSLLRVREDEVESVLRHDERRACETVTRRRFMSAGAAIASAPFLPKAFIEYDLSPGGYLPERLMVPRGIAWSLCVTIPAGSREFWSREPEAFWSLEPEALLP